MDKTYGISVRSVLEMEVLQGAKLIAGRGGLDRVVTSMNVMEVPDIIDWVSGGELIVTTAYSIKDDVEKLVDWSPPSTAAASWGWASSPSGYIRETRRRSSTPPTRSPSPSLRSRRRFPSPRSSPPC